MIGYVTLGTNDLARAAGFYDTVMGLMGATRQWENERGIAWGKAPDQPGVGVMKPYDGKAATIGNGVMIGITVPTRGLVEQMHAKALALGGKDEGPVGPRGEGFFAGYFRDLDGNKLVVYCTA